MHAALQYISKYASKAKLRSEVFSEILNRILGESQPEDMLFAPAQNSYHTVLQNGISLPKKLVIFFLAFLFTVQVANLSS